MTKQLYHHEPTSTILDVILHGSSGGIDTPFIQKVYQNSITLHHNVIAFNFPYLDRGEDHSSGSALLEEIHTLTDIIATYCSPTIKHVNVIGKSLGGLVASKYVSSLATDQHQTFSLFILGFLVADIDLTGFTGPIIVIQGEKDKYGSPDQVREKLQSSSLTNTKVVSLPAADHSYRNGQKEPVFEDQAISLLNYTLKKPLFSLLIKSL